VSLKANVGHLRAARDLTQKELAKALRVAINTLSSWENDQSKAKKLYMFFKLCRALECEHSAFLVTTQPLPSHLTEKPVALPIKAIRDKIHVSAHITSPIKRLREQKGLSQEDLADMVEVATNTIQNWENDRSGLERHNLIARICTQLGCTYRDLVTNIDEKPTEFRFKNSTIDSHPANIPKSYS